MQRYQEDNLRAILFQGAQLGFLLFCQPATWVFSWKASLGKEEYGRRGEGKIGTRVTNSEMAGAENGGLVVFPGIGEKVERQGRVRVREVVEAEVVSL
jgi:hypothetical protein